MTARRMVVCAAALAVAIHAGSCLALDPAQVLAGLARVERSEASFEETRHVAALAAPLVRRGRLTYTRPSELEMVVETPLQERVRIVGGVMTMEGRNGTREVRLADLPLVAAWIEGMRATLAGDAAALARYFVVHASGDAVSWQLDLIPRTTDLAAVISHVVIAGNASRIGRIEVFEASGDRNVMVLSASEKKR